MQIGKIEVEKVTRNMQQVSRFKRDYIYCFYIKGARIEIGPAKDLMNRKTVQAKLIDGIGQYIQIDKNEWEDILTNITSMLTKGT